MKSRQNRRHPGSARMCSERSIAPAPFSLFNSRRYIISLRCVDASFSCLSCLLLQLLSARAIIFWWFRHWFDQWLVRRPWSINRIVFLYIWWSQDRYKFNPAHYRQPQFCYLTRISRSRTRNQLRGDRLAQTSNSFFGLFKRKTTVQPERRNNNQITGSQSMAAEARPSIARRRNYDVTASSLQNKECENSKPRMFRIDSNDEILCYSVLAR